MTRIIPETDASLEAMKRAGAPLTRENYLYWAFAGEPPEDLDWETEASLPAQFSRYALDDPDGGLQ